MYLAYSNEKKIIINAQALTCYTSGQKTGDVSGNHGSEDDLGKVSPSGWNQGRHAAQEYPHGAEVGESTEGIGRNNF